MAILDEAVRMFGEFGFNGLTVHRLAERCGITGAGLASHWFCKRDKLTLELLGSLLAAHVEDPASNSRHVLALAEGLEQQWLRPDMSFDLAVELEKVLDAVLGRGRLKTSMEAG